MAEDPRLILPFDSYEEFQKKIADGTVNPNKHIVFIKDESKGSKLWCRGTLYSNMEKLNELETKIDSVTAEKGERGSKWYIGTKIKDTNSVPTIYENSGITDALEGDLYLNSDNYNVYQCTKGGTVLVAKWQYICNIKGEEGKAFTYDDFTLDQLEELRGPSGSRGATWYIGTNISGTLAGDNFYTESGVDYALVDDMYLNSDTYGIYKCTKGGNSESAKWRYLGNIKGVDGTKWFTGIFVTGTEENKIASIGSSDGVRVDDLYLNTNTGNVYKCVSTASVTSRWDYISTIKGESDGSSFELEPASTTKLGGVKIPLNVTYFNSQNEFGLKLNDYNAAYVNIRNASTDLNGLMTTTDKTDLANVISDVNTLKTKVDNITSAGGGGDVNIIETVQVNGTNLTVTNKTVNIPLASSTSAGVMSSTDKANLDSLLESGVQGPKGDPGKTWYPSVNDDGDISWTENSTSVAPITKNIKGPKGDKGDSGASNVTEITVPKGTGYKYLKLSGTRIYQVDYANDDVNFILDIKLGYKYKVTNFTDTEVNIYHNTSSYTYVKLKQNSLSDQIVYVSHPGTSKTPGIFATLVDTLPNNAEEITYSEGDTIDLSNYYTKDEVYSKSEVYTKNEVYNKTEVDNKIADVATGGEINLDGYATKQDLNDYFPKTGGTITGTTIVSSSSDAPLLVDSSSTNQSVALFRYNGQNKGQVGYNMVRDMGTMLYNYQCEQYLGIKDDGTPYFGNKSNNYELYHKGNLDLSQYLTESDITDVTATENGLMLSSDKNKLDNLNLWGQNVPSTGVVNGNMSNVGTMSFKEDGQIGGFTGSIKNPSGVYSNGAIWTFDPTVTNPWLYQGKLSGCKLQHNHLDIYGNYSSISLTAPFEEDTNSIKQDSGKGYRWTTKLSNAGGNLTISPTVYETDDNGNVVENESDYLNNKLIFNSNTKFTYPSVFDDSITAGSITADSFIVKDGGSGLLRADGTIDDTEYASGLTIDYDKMLNLGITDFRGQYKNGGRFSVIRNGYVYGTLDLISDHMGTSYTAVFATMAANTNFSGLRFGSYQVYKRSFSMSSNSSAWDSNSTYPGVGKWTEWQQIYPKVDDVYVYKNNIGFYLNDTQIDSSKIKVGDKVTMTEFFNSQASINNVTALVTAVGNSNITIIADCYLIVISTTDDHVYKYISLE